jgi:hypothetical protein
MSSQKKELQEKIAKLSKELENLAQNPIKENEAGQIEGGFSDAQSSVDDAPKYDINIYSCN